MRDDDVQELRSRMRLLQRRLRQDVGQLPGGPSRTSMQVLGALTRLPPGAQPRQLADELRMTSSNIAAALRELAAVGFIHREKDPGDARRVTVLVTDSGAAVMAEIRSERDTWFGQAMEALLTEPEQELLIAAGLLMERLADYQHTSAAHRPDLRAIGDAR